MNTSNGTGSGHEDHDAVNSSHPSKRHKAFHYDLGNGSTSLRYDDYTIAWICALHIEKTAAKAMLDEVHETLPSNLNDTNAYTLGRIKQHNIVIACLPAGQYGTNNAASVVTNIIRSFPSIRAGLMVGIGGGVPGKTDMRLGDVVVGTRVMQYDLGKFGSGGQLQRTAIPRFPQQSLLTLVSSLRSEHELGTSRVSSILFDKMTRHQDYCHPSTPDRLFLTKYEHEDSAASCGDCDRSMLASRSTRTSNDPKIHYGAIASGNQVMKDAVTRDCVAKELDIICFEMEAAGLMDALPCLPIRGICDYSDSHKSKEWQKYAAATAAAYARELLEKLPVTRKSQAADSEHVLNSISQNMPPDRRQQLLDSLKFSQIDSRKTTIKAAHNKTCHWFLQHPDYKAWLDPQKLSQHHGFLWIRGKPGAGKSTIMKYIYLKQKRGNGLQPGIIASFFFNARGDYLEKSVSGMYRSLLWQLLNGFPDLQQVFDDPDLVPQSHIDCPSVNVLKDLLQNAIALLGQRSFTCFIDALDECDELQILDMVTYLEELAENCTDTGVRLKICFSSRHYPYIDIRKGISLVLENQHGHFQDLENYIQSRLRIRDKALLEELREKILKKAAGVFLWVVLVVDILNKENSQGRFALNKRLEEIPDGLSELFKDILTRNSDDMDGLLLCILWILFAKRPLSPEEYYHAFWAGKRVKDQVQADPEIPSTTVSDFSDCVSSCVITYSKGLAEITKTKQPAVQFIHESVRDFLLKDGGLHELWPDLGYRWEGTSHDTLKQCCNLYMNHDSVREAPNLLRVPEFRTMLVSRYPFLEYATQHVLYHANAAADAVPQDDFLSQFPVCDWISTNNFFETFKNRQYTPDAGLLYILADKGFPSLIRTRLKEDLNVHAMGEHYQYPLFAALANGHKDAVAALLNSPSSIYDGIDITEGLNYKKDFKKYKNRTPLSWAAQEGRTGIVKLLLLQSCTAVNETDADGHTPFSRASEIGHEDIVQTLMERGVDINVLDENGWEPPLRAIRCGHEAILRPLLENGVNTVSRTENGYGLLSLALTKGLLLIALILVEKGADINAEEETGQTPLLLATDYGYETFAALLIGRGANIEARDKTGQTPLLLALKNDNKAMAELLIKKGAVTNTQDLNGWTPLLRASQGGHKTLASAFIEKGADVNAREGTGWTPLLLALKKKKWKMAELLIEKGAGINVRDSNGWTPLVHASDGGHETVVRLLIEKGAGINAQDPRGWTPLVHASDGGHETVVRLLIEKGADINVRDSNGWTPLVHASDGGHETVVRLLIENGADIEAKGQNGLTPLLIASRYDYDAVARALIGLGACIEAKGHHGWTPLCYASRYGHEVVAKVLIDNGADIHAEGDEFWTPYLLAVKYGHKSLAQLLIETEFKSEHRFT